MNINYLRNCEWINVSASNKYCTKTSSVLNQVPPCLRWWLSVYVLKYSEKSDAFSTILLAVQDIIEDDEKPQILISEELLTKLVLYLFSLHTWHSTNKIHNKVTDNIYSVDHKWFLQVIFKENSILLLNKNQIITYKKNKISI